MSSYKHLFIVNPVAGNGIALRITKTIDMLFKELKLKYEDIDYEIVYTKEAGHATEIARKYSSRGDYRIYAVGGDGTLNEVLNGMVGSNSSLGCIPGGSGNDFIKTIVTKFDRKRILMNTVLGTEEEIDIGEVNGRYFINIASMGFDASVVKNVDKFKNLKHLPNKFAYIASIFDTARNFKNLNLKMVIDDEEFQTEAFMVAIANGKYYGGGIKIAPLAEIKDSLLDVLLVRNMTAVKIMKFLPKAIAGKHMDLEEVTFRRAKEVYLLSDEPVFINIDGEIEARREAHFKMDSQKIKFIMPKNSF